jgi:hypothetical protein
LNASQIVITALGCINPLKGRKIDDSIFPSNAAQFPQQRRFLKVTLATPFFPFWKKQHLHEDKYGT